MFNKVLIANRGEIAVRIIRTLKDMGIGSVAVYSEADRTALHVRYADEAYLIGPAPSAESYLVEAKLLEVARLSGAEAIHPGYGFLSENAGFARSVTAAGLTWIGPSPEAIEAMGEKTLARKTMEAAGVPVVPGTSAITNPEEAATFAEKIGYPVLIKAAAGSGGKGMRRVDEPSEFFAAFTGARREAKAAFGDDTVYVEKFVLKPKHVEFQLLSDSHGKHLHLFERDCSAQRRHQKVVEETPCPLLRDDVRAKMGEVAVMAASAVDYVGAGTVEFLLDADQNFYFLEMNTRLQVEHPVTELVTGLDLVRLQLEIAAGGHIPFEQSDVRQQGHAIECRIYAEDPAMNFMPSPGKIEYLNIATGPGVRDDTGVYSGATVSMFYDPMISKLLTCAPTREQALQRMKRVLSETTVRGIKTNTTFLNAILQHQDFVDGKYDTQFIRRELDVLLDATAASSEDDHTLATLCAVIASFELAESLKNKAPSSATTADDTSVNSWKAFGRNRQLQRF